MPSSRNGRPRTVLTSLAVTLAAGTLAPVVPAAAADDIVLADFESADALDGATLPAPGIDSAERSEMFASEGDASMRFDSGAFESKDGSVFPRVWLNIGSTVPDVDWTQRTYLHVGALNASSERTQMYVVVFDDGERHLLRSQWAEPFEYHVFQIETAAIADAGVDMDHLDKIQISTERSPTPKQMYVDDIRLTDEPADVAAEQARVAPAVIDLMDLTRSLENESRALEVVRQRIRPTSFEADKALAEQAATIEDDFDSYAEQIDSLGHDIESARAIWSGLNDRGWRIKRLSTLVDARSARPTSEVGMGFADSMTRVYPRDLPCDCEFGSAESGAELSMARGEHESIQLVTVPYAMELSDAQVTADVVGGPSDGVQVEVHPVVSFDMSDPVDQRPATPTEFRPGIYEGWTPDAIQTDRAAVDVAAGDVQAFWVSVETAPGTRAGTYPVELELNFAGASENRPPTIRLNVRVWDAAIDDEPQLRTSIGHDPQAYAEPYGVTDPGEVERLTREKYDFLGEYDLQGDNIYRSIYEDQPPSIESLRQIDEEFGGLRQFNIWYFDPRLFDLDAPGTWDAQADELFDLIEPHVEEYREAGYIDEAYFYCCDETGEEYVDVTAHVLSRFKERFPDIDVLTTSIDDDMGRESGLDEYMDWWVRDVPWHDPEIIDERHANGQQAWWYLHQANANPTPNVFVNYDPGQLRNLLGPMSHQAGVDGFLYYRVDRWYDHGIVDDGPLSSWDPVTWGDWAGDGSLFYPGPDGPVPSIRLENMRDGLEDYNLLVALREAIDDAPSGTDPELIEHAEHLAGASDVVTDNYVYVYEPDVYRTWRSDVGETLAELS